jgi:hypothetical protein
VPESLELDASACTLELQGSRLSSSRIFFRCKASSSESVARRRLMSSA